MTTTTLAADDERLPSQLQATYVPAVRSRGVFAFWGTTDPATAVASLGLPPGEATTLATVLPRTPRAWKRVTPVEVPAITLDLPTGTEALVRLDLAAVPVWHRPGPSVAGWVAATRLACELVAHGHVVPGVERDDGTATATARWRVATAGDPRIGRLADHLPPVAHAVQRDGGVWSARDVLLAHLDDVADVLVRASASASGPSAPVDPFTRALTSDHDHVVVGDPDELAAALTEWAAPVRPRGEAAFARLCVRLRPPSRDVGSHGGDVGSHGDDWALDYLLQAVEDPSLVLEATDVWADAGSVTLADRHLPRAQEALVRGLGEAARLFPPIDASLSESSPAELALSASEAADFLTDGAPALSAAGLGVQLPAELTRTGRTRLRARLRVGSTATPGGGLSAEGLTAEAIGDFRWEVAVGDHTLDAAEFAELAAHKRSLVRWRGRWVHVDADELAALARTIDGGGRLDPVSAVAAVLTGEVTTDELGTVEVLADAAAADLLERLSGTAPPEPRLDGVKATLRPYQHRGVAWLQARADIGLGAVLADDMGLGKTLQAIALMAGRSGGAGDRPHLVVCPASVVGNWERELARFAPDVAVTRHHGPDRTEDPDGFAAGSVTVTSYGTMRSDADLLGAVAWDVVVLDEAQAFKNHTTRTARVVRSLDARVKLPMTGTPVENRLAELWAIMDVAVPGLLGPFAAFRRDVATPVERWGDEHATERLRRLTGPFLLRRAKRDPDVAPDLPDKQEQTVPVTLTAEQATLYQAVVDELLGDDESLGEGIERRGRILKLLTALKQVCNHPAQYLGEQGPLAGRSGKLVRATELLGEVVDAGDRALVFTQYRRMGELLARHLTDQLDVPQIPFLHGGTTLARRDELVDAFQTDEAASPILLVSLKAGGTGLNLTRATHVVHYDRWWNPAVEDQATDRAYRIGQDRTVFVHKLTTTGTLEERIAAMLERKRALADAVVGSGEAWLTEMDNDELRDLVRLDGAGVDDDEVVA